MSVVSASSVMPFDSLLAAIGALPVAEQWRLVEKTLKNLKKAPTARKSKKTDASSEEGAEPRLKKEPNVWIKHVGFVRSVMNVLGETDTDAKKAKAVTQVAKALKDSGSYFTSQGEAEAAIEQITTAFQAWKADPPAAAPKEKKEKKPKAAAVDSDSEEGEVVAKKPRKPLSPEAAASKKARTAETKARNKAAKEAASAAASVASAASVAPEAPEADSDAEEGEVAVVRSYDLGKKGVMAYDTYPGEKAGTEYLYEHESGKFVGLYNPATKKLKTDVKDPAAA